MLSVERANNEDHQLENPKNQSIFRRRRTLFLGLWKGNVRANVCSHTYTCYILISSIFWVVRNIGNSKAYWAATQQLRWLSRRIAINARRDNIPINFGALLHAAGLQTELSNVAVCRAIDRQPPWVRIPSVDPHLTFFFFFENAFKIWEKNY